MNILFTSNQVGFHGTPFKRRNALAVNIKGNLFIWDVDYVDSIFVHDGEQVSCLWRELSDFSCWIFWKLFVPGEGLDLVGCVAAVEVVQERTLVGERYKLQLRQSFVLLVLIRLRRLLSVIVRDLVSLFLELLIKLLLVRVPFVVFLLRRCVLIWV